MKKKISHPVLGALAFCILALVLAAVWYMGRPGTQQGVKAVTVSVVHSDGTSKEFSFHTEEEFLGPALLNEGLIAGSDSAYGLFVETVDGETVSGQDWWQLTCNGEYAQTGADTTPIHNKDQFTWTYISG